MVPHTGAKHISTGQNSVVLVWEFIFGSFSGCFVCGFGFCFGFGGVLWGFCLFFGFFLVLVGFGLVFLFFFYSTQGILLNSKTSFGHIDGL